MKNTFFLGLTIAMFLSANNVFASTSGTCGAYDEKTDTYDDCNWSLDDNGSLKVWGTGKMSDFSSSGDNVAPWGRDFESLEISGVTSIGAYAFYRSTNLNMVTIPASVESIGIASFQRSSNISSFEFEEGSNLKSIGSGSIHSLPNLHNIDIPQGVTTIYGNAFNGSGLNRLVLPDSLFETDEITDEFIFGLNERAMSNVPAVYCSEASKSKCETYFQKARYWENGEYYPLKDKATLNIKNADGSVDTYQYLSDGSAAIYRDGTLKSYKGKRIYTIDEANRVAGEVNRISIKYS